MYAVYFIRSAGLDEVQTGIEIARRNINNLRYADDTTLTAESEEELKSRLMRVDETVKKLAQKSAFRKLRSWHLVPSLQRGKCGNNDRFSFLGFQNHCAE